MTWTTDLADQLDWHWQHLLRPRLDGLTDDEYLWEPVPDCWSVRPGGIDFAFPAPVLVRGLFHFIKLRCAKNAHFSIQRVGWGMLEQLRPYFPILSEKIQVKEDLSVQGLTEEYFSQTAIIPEL